MSNYSTLTDSEIKSCPKCGRQLEAFGLCPHPVGCGYTERYGGLYRNPEADDAAIVGDKRLAAVRELVRSIKSGLASPGTVEKIESLAAVWPEAVEGLGVDCSILLDNNSQLRETKR